MAISVIPIIAALVDKPLRRLCAALEQEDSIDISVSNDDKKVSLKALSDGLPGELYTEDGWISRFSNK